MTEEIKDVKEINIELDKPKRETVIVSPHPDDELIGCYSIFKKAKEINETINVVYTNEMDKERREETLKLKEYFSVRQFFVNNIDIPPLLLNKSNIIYVPDHINEYHSAHRMAGINGEKLARQGYNVVYYSIQKNVPYIFELNNKQIKEKEEILDYVYSSQKSLWKYEKKYILFEGFMRWYF